MRHRVSIEIDAKNVGQAFANTDDGAQADMLNEMGKEMKVVCGTNFSMQVCYLSNLLNNSGKDLIKEIYGFIELRGKEEASGGSNAQ